MEPKEYAGQPICKYQIDALKIE